MSSRAVRAALLALCLAGCSSGLDVPEGAQIVCAADAECPDGFRCVDAFSRCVKVGDTTAPVLRSATPLNTQTVKLVVDEPVDEPSAENVEAYVFVPPLEVLAASVSDDGLTIALLTAPQIGGAPYTAIANIYDLAGNPADPTLSKSFTGFGELADFSPPTILAPFDKQRIKDTQTTISWSARRGAHNYTIRASVDPSFAAPEFAVTVPSDTTTYDFTAPTADSYWIEVKADVTLDAPQRVHVAFIGSKLRVYCAPTEQCADAQYAIAGGTIHDPFRSVQLALSVATTLGIKTIEIASRGSEAYHEALILGGGGIDITGGFAPDFADSDPDVNVTTLDDTGITHRFIGISTAETTITGLRFTNSAPRSLSVGATTLRFLQCSDALVFDHCVFAPTVSSAYGVLVAEAISSVGSGPLIKSSRVELDSDVATPFVYLTQPSALTFDTCTITIRARQISLGGSSGAVTIRNSTITRTILGENYADAIGVDGGVIEKNRIYVHSEAAGAAGVVVSGNASVVRNNFIQVDGARGIQLVESANSLVVHNTVFVARGLGPALDAAGGSRLIDNLWACAPSGSTVAVDAPTRMVDQPPSYDNNLSVGCTVAYKYGGGQIDPNTLNGVASCGTGCTAQYRTNPSPLANLSAVFADYDGPDGDPLTFEDNDFHLALTGTTADSVRNGGRWTALMDCGSQQAPMTCGNVTEDFDGNPRSSPESIGADE